MIPPDHYQSLLEAVNGIVWEADAKTMRYTFVSDSALRLLGYTPAEWISTQNFWEEHLYSEDREKASSIYHGDIRGLKNHTIDYRMVKADGSIIWVRDIVSVILENGEPRWLRGIMVDITESKLLSDLDNLEKTVLELNADPSATTEKVLEYYMQGIESLFPDLHCSILKVMDGRLYNWASPSLPVAYSSAISGVEIGPQAGSCGSAAFLKHSVIVNDIDTDERWAPFKEQALVHGLRACWSYPIINADDKVIATLGIYYTKITTPEAQQIAIIERTAQILKIILQNRTYGEMVREANALIAQGQALANFGTWQWDITTGRVLWSDILYQIYGVEKTGQKITYDDYMKRVHPDDVDRISGLIEEVLATKQDTVFEERIICPDGQVKHLKSWARVICDEEGASIKMIGACLDITDVKETRKKMDEIAWMQSHVIRSPLASLMGLVSVLQHELAPEQKDLQDLLNKILDTALDLDKVIHNISDNTRL